MKINYLLLKIKLKPYKETSNLIREIIIEVLFITLYILTLGFTIL